MGPATLEGCAVNAMKSIVFLASTFLAGLAGTVHAAAPGEQRTVLVVVGAEGAEEFADDFAEAAQRWKTACARGGAEFLGIATGEDGAAPGSADEAKAETSPGVDEAEKKIAHGLGRRLAEVALQMKRGARD